MPIKPASSVLEAYFGACAWLVRSLSTMKPIVSHHVKDVCGQGDSPSVDLWEVLYFQRILYGHSWV